MPERALVFSGHDDDDAERAAGHVAHARAGRGQLPPGASFVLHGDEAPRLAVLWSFASGGRR